MSILIVGKPPNAMLAPLLTEFGTAPPQIMDLNLALFDRMIKKKRLRFDTGLAHFEKCEGGMELLAAGASCSYQRVLYSPILGR